MLYLVSTPIGNLSDISFRAIETLKNCDLILCEDTRHSQKLLNHYEIKKPTLSYHKFNEQSQAQKIIEKLQAGLSICVIADAGTPLISDPGSPLVEACIKANIPFTAIPGSCAIIQALILSGLSWEKFQFIGFLPKKEKELMKEIHEILEYSGVSICYETPHRLLDTITLIVSIDPNATISICKELTKMHETIFRGTAKEVLESFKDKSVKGEYVLLLQGKKNEIDYSTLPLEKHVEEVMDQYLVSKKEAIKIVAHLRQEKKRDLYQKLHEIF